METNTYTLYSNLGFIGFALVAPFNQGKQGCINLYDAVTINDNTQFYPAANIIRIFAGTNSTLPDIDIIRQLMQQAIPNLNSTGLTYNAEDLKGTRLTI